MRVGRIFVGFFAVIGVFVAAARDRGRAASRCSCARAERGVARQHRAVARYRRGISRRAAAARAVADPVPGPAAAERRARRDRAGGRRPATSPASSRGSATASSASPQAEELRDAIAALPRQGQARGRLCRQFRRARLGHAQLLPGFGVRRDLAAADGAVGLVGLRAEEPFFRGTLDLLGVGAALRSSRGVQVCRRPAHSRRR